MKTVFKLNLKNRNLWSYCTLNIEIYSLTVEPFGQCLLKKWVSAYQDLVHPSFTWFMMIDRCFKIYQVAAGGSVLRNWTHQEMFRCKRYGTVGFWNLFINLFLFEFLLSFIYFLLLFEFIFVGRSEALSFYCLASMYYSKLFKDFVDEILYLFINSYVLFLVYRHQS